MENLDPKTSALVLIDLQKGIVQIPVAPYSSSEVLAKSSELTKSFRKAGAPVVLVNVNWSADFGDAPKQPVDRPTNGAGGPDWAELATELAPEASDIRITKRQWGAFHGTDLDLQLRRRGVKTVVLGGIATNLGVESTARAAWEHGYNLVVVEDASSSFSTDMHAFSMNAIFPMIGFVRNTQQVVNWIK